jgi:Carboxypeptidase regulatory-like domain
MTIWRGTAVVGVALGLSACNGHRTSSFPGAPLSTCRLSGAVSEMTPNGPMPLEGVQIEETRTHQHTTTDEGGFYDLSGLYAATNTFRASRPGYLTETVVVAITGNQRLDLQLRRVVRVQVPAAGLRFLDRRPQP